MNEEQLHHLRHSLAHLLGASILELYPHAKLTIGPSIDDGFYYDADFGDVKITEADLQILENKMRELLVSWNTFEKREVSVDEAKAYFTNNPYKLELITDLEKEGSTLTFYTSGAFTDLCRGGHMESMQEIKADCFKLDRTSGAYWRGDEKNKMLTRIYGLAFESKEKLDAHLAQEEEARKRDHRKLGKELKLFTISDLVGPGLPLMQPKGAIIKRELEEYLWNLHKNHGYSRVWTPHLAKEALYEMSGHAGHYMDDMFSVFGGSSKEKFYVKPMNCPHHMQIFADNQFSYRDMPVRYFEQTTVYRDEKSGQLGGLTRVRSITQDDGHLFCRSTQIKEEISLIVSIIKEFYTTMGMIDGYWVRLSVRDDNKENYLGSDEIWNQAEGALKDICESEKLPYKEGRGEAAFYGPKLDFMFKDAIGREWQLATVQCDFNLPERFDLSFINEEGKKERPVVIHRAISGSLERFMGVMIEHFAGAFPLWLSPVQVVVLPISEAQHAYAHEVTSLLKESGIRVELDASKESLGKRIRESKNMKVPYAIVIGDKEKDSQTLTLETRSGEKIEGLTPTEVASKLTHEIESKQL
jgi:threonyl-tRNA synthetase